ncbi:MAG: hypothetical protein ABW179_07755 [Methylobacterium sp.]
MLSAIVIRAEEPMPLAATLATLVAGAVEGALREVVVVGEVSAEVRRVADHAGCRVETLEALAGSAAALKGDWVLVVPAGERLGAGWVDLAAGHVATAPAEAGRFVGTSPRAGWRRWFGRAEGPILVPKSHLAAHLRARGSLDGLGRGLRTRALRER